MNNNFRFTNEICPVCKKPFSENDDIVVCPLCGTPHHRDCYKENGECANIEKHSEGFCWSPSQTVSAAPDINNEPTAAPQQTSAPPPEAMPQFATVMPNPFNLFPKEIADGVLTEEAADFVGAASGIKYIQKFFYIRGGKRTFNWAAFLFAPYWFFYRKLHKLGAIFLAVTIGVSLGISLLPQSKALTADMNNFLQEYEQTINAEVASEQQLNSMMSEMKSVLTKNPVGTGLMVFQSLFTLGMHLLAGFMADKWYYDFTVKKVRQIKSETEDINLRKLRFFKEGGIGLAVTLSVLLALETISMLASMFL